MTKFKLPDSARLEVRNGRESHYYSHDQLVQALNDFGEAVATQFKTPQSNQYAIIEHIVKELLV